MHLVCRQSARRPLTNRHNQTIRNEFIVVISANLQVHAVLVDHEATKSRFDETHTELIARYEILIPFSVAELDAKHVQYTPLVVTEVNTGLILYSDTFNFESRSIELSVSQHALQHSKTSGLRSASAFVSLDLWLSRFSRVRYDSIAKSFVHRKIDVVHFGKD